jgi:hypothetical protein
MMQALLRVLLGLLTLPLLLASALVNVSLVQPTQLVFTTLAPVGGTTPYMKGEAARGTWT